MRVTFDRAEFTLLVIAFDFCFSKTSGIVPGVTADEGATCLVFLDVDTGYMKAAPAAVKTVTDYLIEGGLSNSSDVVFDCVVMENLRLWPMALG